MRRNQARILVIDGDGDVATLLPEILDATQHHISAVAPHRETLNTLESEAWDLVVIDLETGTRVEMELMRWLRECCPEASMIVIAEHPTVASAITALRYGVCDYLVKPVQMEELRHSILRGLEKGRQARLKRELITRLTDFVHLLEGNGIEGHQADPAVEPSGQRIRKSGKRYLQVHDLVLDSQQRMVRRGNQWIDLTPTEFELLAYLVRHAGEVQRYRVLVREVLGYDADEWEAKNLIKFHIHRLRKKLEPEPNRPRYILNVRGVGYLFVDE